MLPGQSDDRAAVGEVTALPAAVSVEGLVVRYGHRVAVDGISFEARAGEVTALLGPNGAGKTTTVETLEGYRRPDSGRVRVLGLDPVADQRRLVPRLGVMLQGGGLYPAMGAAEMLRLFASYYDDPVPPAELLCLLGLEDVARTPARRLSGGERQRLALALALVGNPSVLFLDEPTAGVDPNGRVVVRGVIEGLRERGACVVLTTHELAEAERLADRVVIVDHGRIVAEGTPGELTGGAASIRFAAPAGLEVTEMSAALGAAVRELSRGEYEVDASPSPATVAALTSWLAEREIQIGDLRAGRHRLEDVFMRLTTDAAEPSASGRRRR